MTLNWVCAAAVVIVLGASAPAIAFPEKDMTFVVPYAAGGATDVVGRIYAEHMAQGARPADRDRERGGRGRHCRRPRASPRPRATATRSSSARSAPTRRRRACSPICPTTRARTSSRSSTWRPRRWWWWRRTTSRSPTSRSSLAYLKANGDKLNYGSGGAGAQSHLTCAYLNDLAGAKSQHIPFRGSAPALNALIAGQVDYACNNTTEIVPQIQAKTVKPLAIAGAVARAGAAGRSDCDRAGSEVRSHRLDRDVRAEGHAGRRWSPSSTPPRARR